MVVVVLPKWAKFNELTRHWKLYQEFPARTQLFTRQSLDDPWHAQLWLVDVDCAFYDPIPTTLLDEPTLVHVPTNDLDESIAALRKISPEATALLTDLAEARPLLRTELIVKTFDGGHLVFGLVECATTLDFVSEDFVRHFPCQLVSLKPRLRFDLLTDSV
jgi:hypothetical protein